MRADNKLHQRTETPNGRCPEKVQSRHGCLEPLAKTGISLEASYGICQLRGKEVVLGNVHSVSGPQKNMVDGSVTSIVQPDSYLLANRSSGNNEVVENYGHVLEPPHQPACASRPD